MSEPLVCLSRRTFIRVTGNTMGVSALASTLGCYSGGQNMDDTDLMTDRPILTQWADDIVRVGIPLRELPVAYVSMAQRQVFVDPEFRDRASWLLRAHISVSTWHWRIHCPVTPRVFRLRLGTRIGNSRNSQSVSGTLECHLQ